MVRSDEEACWIYGRLFGMHTEKLRNLVFDLYRYGGKYDDEKLEELYLMVEEGINSLSEQFVKSVNSGCIVIDYKTPVVSTQLNKMMEDVEVRDREELWRDFNIFTDNLPNLRTIREREKGRKWGLR